MLALDARCLLLQLHQPVVLLLASHVVLHVLRLHRSRMARGAPIGSPAGEVAPPTNQNQSNARSYVAMGV